MWKQIYAALVLAGAATTIGYGASSLEGGHLPYAVGYAVLLIFAVPIMWIVGANILGGDDKEELEHLAKKVEEIAKKKVVTKNTK